MEAGDATVVISSVGSAATTVDGAESMTRGETEGRVGPVPSPETVLEFCQGPSALRRDEESSFLGEVKLFDARRGDVVEELGRGAEHSRRGDTIRDPTSSDAALVSCQGSRACGMLSSWKVVGG